MTAGRWYKNGLCGVEKKMKPVLHSRWRRKKEKEEEMQQARKYRYTAPTGSSSVAESMGGRIAGGGVTRKARPWIRCTSGRKVRGRKLVVSRSEIVFLSMLVLVLHLHLQARLVGVYNKRGGEQKQGTRRFLYHTHIQLDNVQALCHCPSGANGGNRWAAIRGNQWGCSSIE